MKTLRLVASQVAYTNKAFWRNPASAFFTFAFPLMFLAIFTSMLGHGYINIGHARYHMSTYYVAAMAGYAVVTACYSNIAISVAVQRDSGILKRIHSTPLPTMAYFLARVLHAILMAIVLVAITVTFGALVYQAHVPAGSTLLRFVVMLIVGSASFAALGFAIVGAIPNAEAAPAVVNASILPLLFLSGVFIPLTNTSPTWMVDVAKIFPVRHFVVGLQAAFLGTPFSWHDVLIVGIWGTCGMAVAVRFFSFEPRR
jgi:ABC-2 type transport system permease protein